MSSLQRAGNDDSYFLGVTGYPGGMSVPCSKHLLDPLMVGTAKRLNAGRARPNFCAIRAGLDQNDVYPKRLKLKGDGLGPALECPFRRAIYRVCGLSHESSFARDNDNPARSLRSKNRQECACQLEHTKKVRLHNPSQVRLGNILQRTCGCHTSIVHNGVELILSSGQD